MSVLKRPSTSLRPPIRKFLAVLFFLGFLAPSAHPQEKKKPEPKGGAAPTGEVDIKMSECIDSLWAGMPDGMSSNVELEGPATTPECATAALTTSRHALNISKMLGDMGKSLAITVDLLGKITGYGLTAEVLQAFLESGGDADTFKEKLSEGFIKNSAGRLGGAAGDHLIDEVTKKLGEQGAEALFKILYDALHPDINKEQQDTFGTLTACKGRIVVSIHYSGEFNTGEVRIAVSGDCSCQPFRGGVRIGKFSVIGVAPISLTKPEKKNGKWVMPCKLGQPKYYVAAACCKEKDGHWTGGGPGDLPNEPGQPVTDEPKPNPKKEADYINIERKCDPDGTLRRDIYWHQHRLDELLDNHSSDKNTIDWRRSELTRLRGQLCPCLDKMKADAEKSADQDTLELLKEMIAQYCVAPHRTTPQPPGTPVPPATPAQPECQPEKDKYEKARQEYMDGGTNNPSLELAMARAKKAYCDCMRKKYGGKLPPEIEKFCDPKAMRVPSKPPTETALAPTPNTFRTSSTLIGVVLPSDVRPGDTITGTVVRDPKTYEGNPALHVVELTVPLPVDQNGKTSLHGVVVDIGEHPPMPADTPLVYKVPTRTPSIPVTIRRKEDPVPSTPVKVPVETKTPEKPASPPRYETPSIYTETPLQVVTGKFGGDGNFTQIEMAGKPADVVAESPRAVYWKVPEGVQPGSNKVVVRDGQTTLSFPVSVVRLSINADRLTLKRGESTAYHVTVSGFDGLSDSSWRAAPPSETTDMSAVSKLAPAFQPPGRGADGVVLLTIQNASPGTVTLSEARNEVVVLQIKKSDIKNGTYEYHGTIKSKQPGGFNINTSITSFLSPVPGEVQTAQ
jgi:hypothetical protein